MPLVLVIHAAMNNAIFLGFLSFFLIMVPIVGIMIVNDPD